MFRQPTATRDSKERRIDVFGRWQVRSLRCYEEGLALRGVRIRMEPHPLVSDPSRAVLVEFLAAAVCHRTNWDRLHGHLLTVAAGSDGFIPARLAGLTVDEFADEFADAFGSVTDLPARHRLFTAVAAAFARGDDPFDGRRLGGEPQRLGGPDGLYSALDRLEVFRSDPQRKKSRILVQQLVRTGLLALTDPDQLRPAIEYHLVRLYLRTGRVVHADSLDVGDGHGRASDVRTVTALRVAVEEAMRYTAAAAEFTVIETNDIEWQIARSFCVRSAPRCDGPPRRDKPVDPAIMAVAGGACPFAATCDGSRYAAIAALTEPRLADYHAYY